MRRREFLKGALTAAAAAALSASSQGRGISDPGMSDKLRIRYFISEEGKILPAPLESLKRIYFMDVDYNPLPVRSNPTNQEGMLVSEIPRVPFKITCADWVDGFGWVYIVVDNGGAGYKPEELRGEVNLNAEAARSRLKAVESACEEARIAGVVLSADIQRRIEKAHSLMTSGQLEKDQLAAVRKYWDALSELMWAGETVSVDRARYAISKMPPRKGFKFGANAFHCLDAGEEYTRAFYDLLNYCTLPFYYRSFEPERGKPAWDRLNRMVEWCAKGSITPKGHPLVWFHPAGVPNWLDDKSFDNVKRFHEERITKIVTYYRSRIDYWDVINEAHDFANTLNFSYDQLLDITAAACRTARAANRKATLVVNNTALWGEYAAPKPGEPLPKTMRHTALQYVADCIKGGFDFDVIGLQIYYPHRDMFEIDRMLERFGRFGKPVHITEHAMASDTSEDPASNVKTPWGQWHAPHSQANQADWIEQLWTIAYSKPFVTAITYWDFCDKGGHFWPHGGFLDKDLKPKEVYFRVQKLLRSWGVSKTG
ncbi:MAG: endo-1,4-beta-xylanase [Armatimonadota bacterium]|nr:endo-1,4-beta-xylanase [Armatimonadota bacterium]